MYGWAPLAIMGEEINKVEAILNSQACSSTDHDDDSERTSLVTSSSEVVEATSTIQAKDEAVLPTVGVYLGIWNIFATVPQFLATFIAAIAFSILEPGKSPELGGGKPGGGDTSGSPIQGLSGTAVCLAIGGLCSLVAAVRTFRLPKD